jgi:RecB family endonuclease NucS
MAIIISKKGSRSADLVNKSDFARERNLQEYIYDHPESIPVYEVREDKRLLVAAREVPTESGSIDAFAVDKDGDLYIVETKLYRNPYRRGAGIGLRRVTLAACQFQ